MRIGVNAFPLRAEGGGARYAFAGLMAALLRVDAIHHYIIFAHVEALGLISEFVKGNPASLDRDGKSRVRVIEVADEGQIYGHGAEFDLLFGPLNNLNPRLYDRPSVAILHDIQEQYFPENFSKSEVIGRQEVYPEICRAATTLVAISEFCKGTFVEKFSIDPAKIEVVPNAPQADLVNLSGDGTWSREALPPTYLFYPANCYRHKNHAMLLDVAERLRDQGLWMPIVFSGFELAGGFPLRKEIASRGLGDLCQVFTDLPAAELRYLYRHCAAVVLPTRFEGFGMPSVEAAACGCPVICSDLPPFHETLGDNALYFHPDDVDGACRQIRRILDDAPLRESLVRGGIELAGRYTWDKSARQVLDIFEKSQTAFLWGNHLPESVRRPRIGVSIRLTQGGRQIFGTIECLLRAGYRDLVLRCEVPPGLSPHVRKFLENSGVQIVEPTPSPNGNGNGTGHHDDAYEPLGSFAREERLDLVGEILEGSSFKATGLDSLAWGYLQEPDKAVLLGESMDWIGPRFVNCVRLRLTGDGLWKMEGYLYPELMFINPAALRNWPGGLHMAMEGGKEWRWELLREARRDGRLFMLRRTLADTNQLMIPPQASKQAARAGMFRFYQASNETSVRVRLLRRVEPAIKRAACILPRHWQDAGTRLWYHFSR